MNKPPAIRKLSAILGAALLATLLAAGAALGRDDAPPPPKVEALHLLTAPLQGEPGKEVDIEVYTFPPGSAVPWHIHPDTHEFDYELEGTLTLEVEGEKPRDLKAGEAFYLPPNVVHRGWNASKTETARVYVVRVKPVGKPLTELVEPTSKEGEAAGPPPGHYPGASP